MNSPVSSRKELASMNTDDAVSWGRRTGVGKGDKECKFYESFTFDGVEYALHDCVYMHTGDEPYVGKIIKIWDKPTQPRKVKIQWFFRPTEIWWWLRQHKLKALPNELFIASGEGSGLADTNNLEAIVGKCNVVCISKDERNPQLSEEKLQGADYVFHRTFDVGKCNISEHFGDKIGVLEAKFVFNQKVSEKSEIVKEKAANDLEGKSGRGCVDVVIGEMNGPVRGKKNATIDVKSIEDLSSLDNRPAKRAKFDGSNVKGMVKDEKKPIGEILKKSAPSSIRLEEKKKIEKTEFIEQKDVQIDKDSILGNGPVRVEAKPKSILGNLSPKKALNEEKKSKPTIDSPRLGRNSLLTSSFKDAIVEGRVIDVSRRPDDDELKWFHLAPWEERMLAASDQGSLVFLQNLDPEYTSAEVEDIIWHAFQEKCNAKVVQRLAYSNPLIGQALLIFKSREAAERVVRKLNDGCLVLSGQRPLVGRPVTVPKKFGKQSKFAGHLVIDKLKLQQHKDKDAVSTSHCAQPNTIEHELAMDWCLLQSLSDIWWKKLNEEHGRDLKRLMGGLKSNGGSTCRD